MFHFLICIFCKTAGGFQMSFFVRKCKAVCILALVALFALSGCEGPAGVPQAMAQASDQPAINSEDNIAMLAFLQSTLDDFSVIDKCLTDQSFVNMLNTDTTGNDSDYTDPVEQYLGVLGDYDGRVKARLDIIKTREAPDHPDIASFQASEIAEFELTSNVITEFIQILRYNNSVAIMNNDMEEIGSIKASDLQGIYNTKSVDITSAIDQLKSQEVPSFLKSINDSMIDALTEMNNAVLYAQDAVKLGDPVRSNAAEYRWGMLVRKFKQVYDEVQQDSAGRKTKLKGDVDGIRKTNGALRDWVQGNIDKLNNEQ
jgi:hypothetical protein